MITYHNLKKQMDKLTQLTQAVEATGAQVPELWRGLRNLDVAISQFPKAKETDGIDKAVTEEATFMMMVLQRFLNNQSMACYHFAQRGKSDAFRSCQMKLAQAIRNWQFQNVNFTLLQEEIKASDSKPKGKGILAKLVKKKGK